MDENQRETDCKSCEVACSDFAVGGSEDYEYEEEGSYYLYEESSACSTGSGDTVTTETGRVGTLEGYGRCHNLGEQKEESTGHEGTDDLADPIAAGILPAHTSGECYSQSDGRIDVAA